MASEIEKLLQVNCEKLLEQYNYNLKDLLRLQTLFINDILPSIAEELGLDAEEAARIEDWLQDTTTLFHILRRNSFTKSAAMEYIRKTIVWRHTHVLPLPCLTLPPQLQVLPALARDPFGRPVLCVKAAAPNGSLDAYQPLVIQTIELLRLHLANIAGNTQISGLPLQYVVLLDLKEISVQSISFDLVKWFIRDVIRNFPGMFAAVFMINHSWAHSGLWNLAKRALPETALTRVFFPNKDELVQYFTAQVLPKEYGGALLYPPTSPLRSDKHPTIQHPSFQISPSSRKLSPISFSNPFFGYPVRFSQNSNNPRLRHGRRRKRDLMRTLVTLLWLRWRHYITACLWIVGIGISVRLWTRRSLLYSAQGRQLLNTLWATLIK